MGRLKGRLDPKCLIFISAAQTALKAMRRHWRVESRGLTWSEFIFYKFSLLAVWGGWEAGVWAGGYCIVQGRGNVGLSWTEAVGMERRKYSEEVKRRQNQQDLVLDCGVEKEEADLRVSSVYKNERCLWWDQHAYRCQKIRKHLQQGGQLKILRRRWHWIRKSDLKRHWWEWEKMTVQDEGTPWARQRGKKSQNAFELGPRSGWGGTVWGG